MSTIKKVMTATIKVELSKKDEITGVDSVKLVSYISVISIDHNLGLINDRVLLKTVRLMISTWQQTSELQAIQPIECTLSNLCVMGWNVQLNRI